jgi:hypothetical protein
VRHSSARRDSVACRLQRERVVRRALLVAYGMGNRIPLLIVGATAGEAVKRLQRFGWTVWVERAAGLAVLGIGAYKIHSLTISSAARTPVRFSKRVPGSEIVAQCLVADLEHHAAVVADTTQFRTQGVDVEPTFFDKGTLATCERAFGFQPDANTLGV